MMQCFFLFFVIHGYIYIYIYIYIYVYINMMFLFIFDKRDKFKSHICKRPLIAVTEKDVLENP